MVIVVDEQNVITAFHINSGYPFQYFNIETPQALEHMLLTMFGGFMLVNPAVEVIYYFR